MQGDFVVLASEGSCLVGVDVAAPQQLRRGGSTRPLLEVLGLMRKQLCDSEVRQAAAAVQQVLCVALPQQGWGLGRRASAVSSAPDERAWLRLQPLWLLLQWALLQSLAGDEDAAESAFQAMWSCKEVRAGARAARSWRTCSMQQGMLAACPTHPLPPPLVAGCCCIHWQRPLVNEGIHQGARRRRRL